jgi:hypothetical protein
MADRSFRVMTPKSGCFFPSSTRTPDAQLDVGTGQYPGTHTGMTNVMLDWSTAQVEDSDLTVALEGDPSKTWKGTFETTLRLLGTGDWGEVRLRKGKIRVSDVTPGSEEKLRHHLEAIVAQANAHEEANGDDGQPPQDDAKSDERQDHGPDAEMTNRFRSFAEDDPAEVESGENA